MQGITMPSGFAHDLDPLELQDLRNGSQAALAAAYDRFSGPVYGLALRVLGHPQDAADVVQEVFLKLPRASRRFRGDAPFGLWLRRLATNATVDMLRHRRNLVPLEDAHREIGDESSPASITEAHALLERLSPTARLVLLLHAVDGYTHAEMAALFGQSESYSKSILSRALKRLRSHLVPEHTHVNELSSRSK
jgi:RNA polymerase sigma-70 factor (ECF subfamily)